MDTQLARGLVRCKFYERVPVGADDGQTRYRYNRVDAGHYEDALMNMWLAHPPEIGDLVHIDDGYRVIDRSWTYSRRGSSNWPAGEPMPITGQTVRLIVEREDGPFIDEAETPDEDDEQDA